jgi:hypothetical protein
MTCDDDNQTADDCKDTETYIVDKTLLNEVCGHCVDCADENDPHSPCSGMYTCSGGGRVGIGGGDCTCGKVTYYKDCLVNETCFFTSGAYENCLDSYSNTYATISRSSYNYELRGEKCTTLEDKKIYVWRKCDAIDCYGDKGSAYGLKKCTAGLGVGDPVECGGINYYAECANSCTMDNILENGKWCYAYTTAPNGYYFVREKCTQTDGTTVNLYGSCTGTDCEGNKGPAYGLTTCEAGYYGTGKTVECGGRTYAEKCEKEQCTETSVGNCQARTDPNYLLNNGYYSAGQCTKHDNSVVYWLAPCNSEITDCAGNKSPVYGMHVCDSGYMSYGDIEDCGGKTYSSKCVKSCVYEQKEEDCGANQTFKKYCLDENRVWYGKCE